MGPRCHKNRINLRDCLVKTTGYRKQKLYSWMTYWFTKSQLCHMSRLVIYGSRCLFILYTNPSSKMWREGEAHPVFRFNSIQRHYSPCFPFSRLFFRVYKKTSGNGHVSILLNIVIMGQLSGTLRSTICMRLFQFPEITSSNLSGQVTTFRFSPLQSDCPVLGEERLCGPHWFSGSSWYAAQISRILEYNKSIKIAY